MNRIPRKQISGQHNGNLIEVETKQLEVTTWGLACNIAIPGRFHMRVRARPHQQVQHMRAQTHAHGHTLEHPWKCGFACRSSSRTWVCLSSLLGR